MRVLSSKTEFEDFKNSMIWKDLSRELKMWVRDVKTGFMKCQGEQELGVIQGRVEAIEYLLQLPDRMIVNIIDTKESDDVTRRDKTT